MVTRTSPFALLALAATALGAAPASASTFTLLAPFGAFQARPACTPAINGSGSLAGAESKASAILGGGVSQLERIAAQQAATALSKADTGAASGTIGWRPEPAAGGVPCAGLALPQRGGELSLGQMPGGAMASPDDYLGSRRLAVRHTAFDRQWDRVRHGSVSQAFVRQIAATSQSAGDEAMLQAVNSWTNRHVRYVEDSKLYGRSDYWAGAQATLERGAGDCEDIAIAKLALLNALGVPRSDVFLTIARDRARNADHALLVVKRGGRYWLLDNGTDRVLDASSSYDYQPIMSFSGDRKWLHGFAGTRLSANF
ncbi:transglutaminase-like cysteine peptidase [Novosphingobium sp. JCM 18896]|uniref:transglutaminase-like cysteine peptidase n=1 Tax=Novosphingobium sp. JCM 18896 TaxID=2989731 RepID=UPI00222284B2|nr:transglutaminase-like cysteine peptidase [Novosphingobium sp. JCM 18896]MCW1430681.1 transglutaminase-like cysteine peptidase [Novosphingobium sp. JCM 18896]